MKKIVYLFTVYTPNSQEELRRLDYRMKWEDDFRAYLKKLEEKKPVIVCGDLNVAHKEIDLKNPKTNRKNAGFTDEERAKFTTLLESGFTDTFRYFYPEQEGIYSWWSYRFKAREKNSGWRIDYFLTSDSLKDRLKGAHIYTDTSGRSLSPIFMLIFKEEPHMANMNHYDRNNFSFWFPKIQNCGIAVPKSLVFELPPFSPDYPEGYRLWQAFFCEHPDEDREVIQEWLNKEVIPTLKKMKLMGQIFVKNSRFSNKFLANKSCMVSVQELASALMEVNYGAMLTGSGGLE